MLSTSAEMSVTRVANVQGKYNLQIAEKFESWSICGLLPLGSNKV